MQGNCILVEDAFRLFDYDFDGKISKNDLKRAVNEHIKEPGLTEIRLDRLFKLLDRFNRNNIQYEDFKRTFEDPRGARDWKDAAKRQLIAFINQNYSNNKEEAFSQMMSQEGLQRITSQQFQKFIEEKRALQGFNLTSGLTQQLFIFLDTQRKGYLTRDDFQAIFGKDQNPLKEIRQAINSAFDNIQTAFAFFLGNQMTPNITFQEFNRCVQHLLPRRFTEQQLRQIFQDLQPLNVQKFQEVFKLRPATSLATSRLDQNIVHKVRDRIRASSRPAEDIFREADTDHSGKLSTIEFRNAMRKLNLGLSARDLDQLQKHCDINNDGQVDLREFMGKLGPTEVQSQLQQRISQRIKTLSQDMYDYLLSPQDAFNQFDIQRTGKLTFGQFQALVQQLNKIARRTMPPFNVIRDIFNEIDVRKDGIIDKLEWQSSFPSYEGTKQFQGVCQQIARHRKLIQQQLPQVVDYEQTVKALSDILSVNLDQNSWHRILSVAMKYGKVDIRQLLEIYKERGTSRPVTAH